MNKNFKNKQINWLNRKWKKTLKMPKPRRLLIKIWFKTKKILIVNFKLDWMANIINQANQERHWRKNVIAIYQYKMNPLKVKVKAIKKLKIKKVKKMII